MSRLAMATRATISMSSPRSADTPLPGSCLHFRDRSESFWVSHTTPAVESIRFKLPVLPRTMEMAHPRDLKLILPFNTLVSFLEGVVGTRALDAMASMRLMSSADSMVAVCGFRFLFHLLRIFYTTYFLFRHPQNTHTVFTQYCQLDQTTESACVPGGRCGRYDKLGQPGSRDMSEKCLLDQRDQSQLVQLNI